MFNGRAIGDYGVMHMIIYERFGCLICWNWLEMLLIEKKRFFFFFYIINTYILPGSITFFKKDS